MLTAELTLIFDVRIVMGLFFLIVPAVQIKGKSLRVSPSSYLKLHALTYIVNFRQNIRTNELYEFDSQRPLLQLCLVHLMVLNMSVRLALLDLFYVLYDYCITDFSRHVAI